MAKKDAADAGDDASKPPLLVSFIAGGVAGGVEATVTYPFEFAKTRVQLRSEGASNNASRNPFRVVTNVIQKEGIRALYTGCSSLIVGTIAKDSIRFLCFDSIKNAFADPSTGTLSPLRNLLAGMSAGVVASILAVTPTERIKTAMIDDAQGEKRFHSPMHTVRTLVREKGYTALYRGFVTTTLKQASTTSVRMGSYNILKDFEKGYDISQNTAMTFANGAVAGTVTVFATQPFDTVKTRVQSAKGAGTVEATLSVMKDFGVRGFWRGSTMRLGRTVLAGGILFTVFEQVTAVLKPVFR